MPKASSKPGFYAVSSGRQPGVYLTWDECESQVKGFPGARYKKFSNASDAETFANSGPDAKAANLVKPPARSEAPSQGPRTQELYPKLDARPSTVVIETKSESSTKIKTVEQTLEDEAGWNVVYSDGACRGNGKLGAVAGIGVWWGRRDPRNLSERCSGDQTNNRAELIAIVRVLETTPINDRPLLIKTDSQYSINCIQTWLPKWLKNNWVSSSREPVKNKEIIQYLSTLLDIRAKARQKVRLQYVKGHSGEEGNDGADLLAVQGTMEAEIPEKDWTSMVMHLLEKTEACEVIESKTSETAPVEFELFEGDLLSPEELEELEMNDFD